MHRGRVGAIVGMSPGMVRQSAKEVRTHTLQSIDFTPMLVVGAIYQSVLSGVQLTFSVTFVF
jgi:hypothetical protein